MIEVELKCEILPAAWFRLREHLRSMQLTRTIKNSDIYYDTVAFNFLRQAVFVRIRNQSRLEFKFNEQADTTHVQSTERDFALEPAPEQGKKMNELFSRFLPTWEEAPTVATALRRNNLHELAYINNMRQQYRADDMLLCVDHVEGLGDFLEVEIQCEEDTDTSQALSRLQHFIADLALQPLPVGYVELWLRLHHPQIYQQGKYQL